MFSTIELKRSVVMVKPSSLPFCTISISSTASTITEGVTSASAAFNAASLSGRRFGFFWRSAAIWRPSRSVLVMISPFTFTSTCSMMSVAPTDMVANPTASAAITPILYFM